VEVVVAAVVVVEVEEIEVAHEAGVILQHAAGDPPHILQTGVLQGAALGLDPALMTGDKMDQITLQHHKLSQLLVTALFSALFFTAV